MGVAAALGLAACASGPTVAPVDEDAQEQAEEFLSRLTLEEKLSLTHGNSTMYVSAIPAKGIPDELAFSDGPNTVRDERRREDFADAYPADDPRDAATVFPALTGLAQTWDPDLARRFGEAMGTEARARGKDVMLGPGLNIARTPLCGRNYEYMGEDPLLTARMAVPLVQGMQSKDVAACVKHFAVNNQELNRAGVDARPDSRALREIYLPAFEAAVTEGGALTVMNAYNKLNGAFCSHNAWLNNELLKGEWGFPGFVVTDWGSLHDTVAGALGGTDVEMNGGKSIRYFKEPLAEAVKAGKVPESRIDDMARRVLYVQAKLGKLDGRPRAEGAINTPEHQALAREIGTEGMVLLKNDTGVLPLDAATLRRVLVVGEIAQHTDCDEGWSAEGKPPYDITILKGLQEALPGAAILYAPFPALNTAVAPLPDSCLITENPNRHADTGMTDRGWLWERFGNDNLQGKPVATGFARTPGLAKEDAKTPNFSMRWQTTFRAPETGEYILGATCDDGVRVYLDGQRVIDSWKDGARRAVTAKVRMEKGKTHKLLVEYRQAGGDAVLAFGWRLPSQSGADYGTLLAEAKRADAVILVTGNRKGFGPAHESEGADRRDIDLLPQDNLGVKTLMGANPRTVILVQAGSPVLMPWFDQAKTVLNLSFLGQETGRSVAEVLLGKREPAGRLCQTWPKALQDSPAHALGDYHKDAVKYKEGILVGYRWYDAKAIEPRFPFGYGLGYTTFDFGEPEVSTWGERVTIRVPVTNTGKRAGAAVVQLYVEPPKDSAVFRAPRQLAAFAKVRLVPGETDVAEMEIGPRAFAWWDESLPGWRREAGDFTLAIGKSSRDIVSRVPIARGDWEAPTPTKP